MSLELDRRSMLFGAAATLALRLPSRGSPVQLIEAPSNLGLRPPRTGHQPGTWQAPKVLREAGLAEAIGSAPVISLPRPPYRFDVQRGSRIRNGVELRRFSILLAQAVARARANGRFPLVIGGDCSILLGCLLGTRAAGKIGLVHVDGHSDFYHPDNYDDASRPGSAAGMDLALATGRGEALLARWNGKALVDDPFVVQVGERDELDADYDYRDIIDTQIRRLPVRDVHRLGLSETARRVLAPMAGRTPSLWVHVDLDVIDRAEMTAVDSPGFPGLTFAELKRLLADLLSSGRVIGLDVAIYDPELDPMRMMPAKIIDCLRSALAPRPQE